MVTFNFFLFCLCMKFFIWAFSISFYYIFSLLTHFLIISFLFFPISYFFFFLYLGNENYVCTIWETCFLLILSLFFLASYCKDHNYFFKRPRSSTDQLKLNISAQHFFSLQHIYFFLSLRFYFSPNMRAFRSFSFIFIFLKQN